MRRSSRCCGRSPPRTGRARTCQRARPCSFGSRTTCRAPPRRCSPAPARAGANSRIRAPSPNSTMIIALEEHYVDPEVARHFKEGGPEARDAALRERLHDVGALRIREMDEVGIDIQVLSHSAPATQRLDADTAPAVARAANDRLRETVRASNGRFEAFATLPSANPRAAADELERAVTQLGFKGAMIHGLSKLGAEAGKFIDAREFWPIFERAQALDVPIYIHPAVPHPAVVEAYYRDYLKDFPGLLT